MLATPGWVSLKAQELVLTLCCVPNTKTKAARMRHYPGQLQSKGWNCSCHMIRNKYSESLLVPTQIILGTIAIPDHNNCYLNFFSLNLTVTFFALGLKIFNFFFIFLLFYSPRFHLLSCLHSKYYSCNIFPSIYLKFSLFCYSANPFLQIWEESNVCLYLLDSFTGSLEGL